MTLRFLKIWGCQKLTASLPYSWFPRKQKFYSVLVVTWNQLKIKIAILNQNLDISKIAIYQISYAWPTERPYVRMGKNQLYGNKIFIIVWVYLSVFKITIAEKSFIPIFLAILPFHGCIILIWVWQVANTTNFYEKLPIFKVRKRNF